MNCYTIKSAYWLNIDHTMFNIILIDDNKCIPFTYVADGSDDNDSEISKFVQNAYKSGELKIEECPDSVQYKSELRLSNEVRHTRNKLMSDTDYLMTADYPITEENLSILKEYRQALRDITSQEGFPHHVDWPKKPDFIIK